MLLTNIKKTAISIAIAGGMMLSANAILADGMDESDYPPPSGHETAISKIGSEHQKKMRAINKEYKKKFAPYSAESIQLRTIEADLLEARMIHRDELEAELMKRKLALTKTEMERNNPYVLKTKARNRFFNKKNKNK